MTPRTTSSLGSKDHRVRVSDGHAKTEVANPSVRGRAATSPTETPRPRIRAGGAVSSTQPEESQPMTTPRQCERIFYPGDVRRHRCENTIAADKRADTRYCSARCGRAVSAQRRAARTKPKTAEPVAAIPTVIDPASFGYGPRNRPPWNHARVTQRMLDSMALHRPEDLATYLALVAEGEERKALREAGEAYDYTDAEGVRHLWHPAVVEEVEAHLAEALEAKAKTPPTLSPHLPASPGALTKEHYGPGANYGDHGPNGSAGMRPTRNRKGRR